MRISSELPLYRVTVPTPFPVGPVHLYVIAEPELTLIDSGPRTREARAELNRLLAADGFDPEKIRRIILTHSHQDHYGMAAELARRSGAAVYAHPVEHAVLRHDASVRRFIDRLIAESGTPPDLVEKMRRMIAFVGSTTESLDDVRSIDELPGVACGDARLEFVPLPGHTPGSVGLWEPRRSILIGGDATISNITPNPFSSPDASQPHGRFRSLAEYWETFRRIRQLNPAIIHAGHLEPITDFPAYEKWSWDLHVRRQNLIVDAITAGARTVHQIALALFPEVVPQGAFLALTEILSHVDLLEEEGKIDASFENGIGVYHVAAPAMECGATLS